MSSPGKSSEYYMELIYPIELLADRGAGGFVASHPDLEGCIAQGETPDEAVAALEEARRLWITSRIEDGLSVPAPLNVDSASGRFLVRTTPRIHGALLALARREGVSLNLLVSTGLGELVGRRERVAGQRGPFRAAASGGKRLG